MDRQLEVHKPHGDTPVTDKDCVQWAKAQTIGLHQRTPQGSLDFQRT